MTKQEQKVVDQLRAALSAAQQHLEYCNYGDSWERECAEEAKLALQIARALDASGGVVS